jgi:hypothetical protein
MLAKRACRSPPTQHRAARLVGTGRPQKKPAEAGLLAEEKHADKTLTELAERALNEKAA